MPSNPRMSSELITHEVTKIRPFVESNKFELILSGRELRPAYKWFLSPFCIIYIKEHDHDEYREIGRTQYIFNTFDPSWSESVIVDYNPRITQHMMFEVHDHNKRGNPHFLGRFNTTLAELVQNLNVEFFGQINGPIINSYYGYFIVVPGMISGDEQIIEIDFRARDLKNRSWFNKKPAFLVISRLNNDDSYSVIARTDRNSASLNPIWPLRLRPSSLCHSNLDHAIRIECFDYNIIGLHEFVGSVDTTLRTLSDSPFSLIKWYAPNIAGKLKVRHIRVV